MMDGFMNGFRADAKLRNVRNKAKYEAFIDYVSTECADVAKRVTQKELPEIYDKYFTEKELDEMIKFQLSPLGKKMTRVLPSIQTDPYNDFLKTEYPQLKLKIDQKLSEITHNTVEYETK